MLSRLIAAARAILTAAIAAGAVLAPSPARAEALTGAPWRTAPLGLAAAIAPTAPTPLDPADALRGATLVGITPQADSTLLIEARTSTGRSIRFTLAAADWRGIAGQLGAPLAPLSGLVRRPGANEGRGSLVLFQTVLGLGYYGWAVPKVLAVHDGKGQIGLYMLTASAGFAIPFLLTRHADISSADTRMVGYGATRGLGLGLFANSAIARERDYASYLDAEGNFDYLRYDLDREHDDQRKYGLGLLGSVAGSVAGYYVSGALQDNPARCEFVGACGDYGAALGLAAGSSFGWYDSGDQSHRHARGLLGAGSFAAGLATGAVLSDRVSLGTGDSYVLRDAIALGAQIGLPIGHALGPANGDHTRAVERAAIVGSLAGMVLGHRLIAEDDYSESEGLLQTAGQLAGGLFALGVAYLTSSDRGLGTRTALTVAAAGSTAGFTLMNRAVHRRHQTRGTR